MSKVYKPGERRKSLSECGCAAQCAEGGGDELCAWDPCVCGVVTHVVKCCDRMAMPMGCESTNSSSKRVAGPHHAAPHELRVSSRESQSTIRPLSYTQAQD
jgi:hypothetical protein